MKKQPIISNNPIEAVLSAQGMTPPTVQETTAPQQTTQEAAPTARKVDYITIFGEYAVPTIRKVPKSRRVQLQLYPETYKKGSDIAAALELSFNDVIAAAIEKMYNDYTAQGNG